MKTFLSAKLIVIFLLLCSNGVKTQTLQPQLNQVELMKQWVGSWRVKGTYITSGINSFGIDGLEGFQKTQFKDSIASEHKFIYGYDKKSDKYISASISKNKPGVSLMIFWFTSENTC
jgi:hypothetical protein